MFGKNPFDIYKPSIPSTPVVSSIPITSSVPPSPKKKKKNALAGATGALAAAQPWIAVAGAAIQVGLAVYTAKKEKKRAENQARINAAEKARVQAIFDNLEKFTETHVSTDASSKESIFWKVIIGLLLDKFIEGKLPTYDFDFLEAMYRRIAMSTLGQGRTTEAGLFFALPFLLSPKGDRRLIGIVIRGWKTAKEKTAGDKPYFLHYFQTEDIGLPAQAYSLEENIWAISTTPERFVPIDFPKELNTNLIDNIYIVPNNLSVNDIKSDKIKGIFSCGSYIFSSSSSSSFDFLGRVKLEKGTFIKDTLIAPISDAIGSFYSSSQNEKSTIQINKAQYLNDHPEERYLFGSADYDYAVPMISFTPYVQIKENSILLDWYDSYNEKFFKDTASSLPTQIVKLLLFEKGFYNGEMNSILGKTGGEFNTALNNFRIAYHINPIPNKIFIDKITESALRDVIHLTRRWNTYTWGGKDGDIDFSHGKTNINLITGTMGGIQIKATAIPLKVGDAVPLEVSGTRSHWADRYYSANNTIREILPSSNVCRIDFIVYFEGKDEESSVAIKIPANYRLLGFSANNAGESNEVHGRGLGYNSVTQTISTSMYHAGGHRKGRYVTYTLFVMKIESFPSVSIFSKPYFPIIHDIGDLQLDYTRVKSFMGANTNITFFIEDSTDYSFSNPTKYGSVATGISINKFLRMSIPFKRNALFCRWKSNLQSTGAYSPILTEVELSFSRQESAEALLSLPKQLINAQNKLASTNEMLVSSPKEIKSPLEVKKLFLEAKVFDLSNEIQDIQRSIDNILSLAEIRALTADETKKIDSLLSSIEKDLPITSIGINENVTKITQYLSTKITESKQILNKIITDWDISNFDDMAKTLGYNGASDNRVKEITQEYSDLKVTLAMVSTKITSIKKIIDGLDYSMNIQASFENIAVKTTASLLLTSKSLKRNIDEKLLGIRKDMTATIQNNLTPLSTIVGEYWVKVGGYLGKKNIADTAILSAFPSTIKKGESSLLTWSVAGGTDINVGGQDVSELKGTQKVSPSVSSTFKLIVDKVVLRTVNIIVEPVVVGQPPVVVGQPPVVVGQPPVVVGQPPVVVGQPPVRAANNYTPLLVIGGVLAAIALKNR